MADVLYISLIFAFCLSCVTSKKPDIIFFLTDDQDQELFGMMPMEKTTKLIAKQGVTFSNAFVTTPICCVSRSSILTGLYAHNHGTTNNSISGGCSSTDWQKRFEWKSLANWLQQAGYITFYAGKYLNKYGRKSVGGHQHIPKGWHWWNALIGNSVYYNYSLSVNGTVEKHGCQASDYLTTVIEAKAMNFINFVSRIDAETPIFMMLAPPAPHAPFTPQDQFKHLYANVNAPRMPNFGKSGDTKHWMIRRLARPIDNDTIDIIDQAYRNRWKTLKSVDRLVEKIISKVESIGRGENTYFVYSSDNGYHAGQFGMPLDKRQLYEFDIKVPLLVSGPTISTNIIKEEMVLNIDIAPTILHMAGVDTSQLPPMDGKSFLRLLQKGSKRWRSHSLIEYWGEGSGEAKRCQPEDRNLGACDVHCNCYCYDSRNNTYACLRTLHKSTNTVYCTFNDDHRTQEFYDIRKDKYQLKNKAAFLRRTVRSIRITLKMQKHVRALRKCVGKECWR